MVSARLGWTMVEQGNWLLDHAEEFPLPLLLVVGSNERIVARNKIEEFARLAPQVDLKIWQNLYHETHNEPDKEMVFQFELKWVKDHLK
jgi:acylglycerol lipase